MKVLSIISVLALYASVGTSAPAPYARHNQQRAQLKKRGLGSFFSTISGAIRNGGTGARTAATSSRIARPVPPPNVMLLRPPVPAGAIVPRVPAGPIVPFRALAPGLNAGGKAAGGMSTGRKLMWGGAGLAGIGAVGLGAHHLLKDDEQYPEPGFGNEEFATAYPDQEFPGDVDPMMTGEEGPFSSGFAGDVDPMMTGQQGPFSSGFAGEDAIEGPIDEGALLPDQEGFRGASDVAQQFDGDFGFDPSQGQRFDEGFLAQ